MPCFRLVLLLCLALGGCANPVRSEAPEWASVLVDVRSLAPDLALDIRYATADNFTGRPVPGYSAPKCLLHRPVAQALARVEQGLRGQGMALVVYDCYRPTVSVSAFMAWAKDADQSTKAAFYPELDKSVLVPDYIAQKSGHSRAATVDVGLLDCRTGPCRPFDMGTAFDYFGPRANTAYPQLSTEQRGNRAMLLGAMAAEGFENYPMEWWHFTWKAGELPDTAYAFLVE